MTPWSLHAGYWFIAHCKLPTAYCNFPSLNGGLKKNNARSQVHYFGRPARRPGVTSPNKFGAPVPPLDAPHHSSLTTLNPRSPVPPAESRATTHRQVWAMAGPDHPGEHLGAAARRSRHRSCRSPARGLLHRRRRDRRHALHLHLSSVQLPAHGHDGPDGAGARRRRLRGSARDGRSRAAARRCDRRSAGRAATADHRLRVLADRCEPGSRALRPRILPDPRLVDAGGARHLRDHRLVLRAARTCARRSSCRSSPML